ncbi:MAG TPA: helix-turn-helix transcriptional regulator [Flavobacteriaceae bacterium]|nr:helix-turn-helix transcriptional regulator [Flavobacteriaceae bacterium]
MKIYFLFTIGFFFSLSVKAQYVFEGEVDQAHLENSVYLSLIEDYRKLSGVFSEQIISKQSIDSLGQFQFSGNQLETENRIYRIHIDNCKESEQEQNHFDGHCDDSKEILFIAKNTDTIEFPFSFDNQIFCQVNSNNAKANAFVRIDSLKEVMKYDYGEFRSEANRKLNNKKWFKTLQDFGIQLDEPLAELSIYAFLSDRSNNFHQYYLEDLKTNSYYDDLSARLNSHYPNSMYVRQYENELNADKFSVEESNKTSSGKWSTLLLIFFGISLVLNGFLLYRLIKRKGKNKSDLKSTLTKQEQNILQLLLEDKSNKDIAEALFVSVSTVKTHVNNVYKKLNVQTRNEVKTLFNK